MPEESDAVLMTPEQIAELGLPPGEAYMDVFVLNDKMTNSGWHEGGPWQVPTAIMEQVGATVVGRPFVVGPDAGRHLRAASGTAEDVIRMQEKYAVGEFVKTFKRNGNIRGAVRLFKEFVDRASKGLLPKYSSPMVDPEGFNPLTRQISGGRVIHVQAVGTPGFDPAVSKLGPVCVGMLDKCMNKLKLLAAAGHLIEHQDKIPESDNSLSGESGDDYSEMDAKAQAALVVAEIIKDPEQVKKLLAAAGPDAVQELLNKAKPEGGADSSTEQEEQTADALKGVAKKTAPKADAEGNTAPENDKQAKVNTADDPVVKALRDEVDALKADKADKERADVIRDLVDLETQLHITDASKRAERIKHYKELKGDKGSIGAFELLMDTLRSKKKELLGAAGDAQFPHFRMGEEATDELSTDQLVDTFESVRRAY